MSIFVHFDVATEYIERAKKFYETLINWEITPAPGPMKNNNIIIVN